MQRLWVQVPPESTSTETLLTIVVVNYDTGRVGDVGVDGESESVEEETWALSSAVRMLCFIRDCRTEEPSQSWILEHVGLLSRSSFCVGICKNRTCSLCLGA